MAVPKHWHIPQKILDECVEAGLACAKRAEMRSTPADTPDAAAGDLPGDKQNSGDDDPPPIDWTQNGPVLDDGVDAQQAP